MPLNADQWERELGSLLARHDEFQDYALQLDEQFDDQLVFRVFDFDAALSSDVLREVAEYGSVLQIKIGSAPLQSRRKVVSFIVTQPSDSVLRALRHYSRTQLAILDSRVWPPQVILAVLLCVLLALGHACYLLHWHWHDTEEPWEGLLHWLLATGAYLWPFGKRISDFHASG